MREKKPVTKTYMCKQIHVMVILGYAILYYRVPGYAGALQCHAMLSYTRLFNAMLYYAMLSYDTLCYAMLC